MESCRQGKFKEKDIMHQKTAAVADEIENPNTDTAMQVEDNLFVCVKYFIE